MAVNGNCHICGRACLLSFEHVPPRAAFNDRQMILTPGDRLIGMDLDRPRGQVRQGGAGGYTLCRDCNSNTGAWYGRACVEWTYQARIVLDRALGQPAVHNAYRIHPLRVLKQVLCMFFSANGPGFAPKNEELVRLVLNKEARGLPPQYRVYAFFNTSQRARQTGIYGKLTGGEPHVGSEIAFPPLGYLMTFESAPPAGLADISFMADAAYNEERDVLLTLPLLPVYTYLPGDYRDRETARRDAERNRREWWGK